MAKHRQDGNVIRGLVYGVLLSIPLWALIGLAIWYFGFR